MTDNTQELDKIMDEIYDLAYDHLPERGIAIGTDRIKQAILDWHNKQVKNAVATAEDNLDQYWNKELNKQVEEVLDRLESQSRRADDCTDDTLVVKMVRVEAERNKLKERDDDQL